MLKQKQKEQELLGYLDGSIAVPNPAETKNSKRWAEEEENHAEYFQTASSDEMITTVLSRMKGIYALADRSKSLKGTLQKQLKETTATVIGAITALNQRLSNSEISEKMESFSRQIRRLKE